MIADSEIAFDRLGGETIDSLLILIGGAKNGLTNFHHSEGASSE
ncbi:hypothetical protein [Sedimentitalea todarodis]|uniref:Uncharacterized protein n=1 Tax=Sedimentitalea todarodis TaxID=1631240 RepID=A0ABU3VEA2_9RHOB|nr:hypothetical protein [Sedimentitalea todarodis]MDU9004497.1 hypothetical protein [Sedimentitalea todarodis]